MAGNAAVLKHASNVPGCSVAIEKIFTDSGFPENLFRSLLIPASEVENIIGNKIIKAVILTGSESAGRHVAKAAGKHLKKLSSNSEGQILLLFSKMLTLINAAK